MLRQIIKPQKSDYTIHIPEEYINQELEILVVPFNNNNIDKTKNINDALKKSAGIFKNKIIDPVEWQRELRSEWNRK